MAKMKIFELKNEINNVTKGKLESKDILDFLDKSFNVKKTHSSSLEDNEVAYVKNYFIKVNKKDTESKPVSAPAPVVNQGQAPTHRATTEASPKTLAPTGAGVQASQTGSRPVGQNASHSSRPATPGQTGSTQMNQRPAQGQYTARPSQTGQNRDQRPMDQGHQSTTGQRPAGGHDALRQGQQGYQGSQGSQGSEKPTGEQDQNNSLSQKPVVRPATEGTQVQRPTGDRPTGDRPAYNNNGYQGNRPAGDRPGYQGNRPAGDRPGYQGNRPAGDRPAYNNNGYQGNRPAGDRPTGDRPAYNNNGYQGNRPAGDRPAYNNNGYQGNRPAGDRPAGDSRPPYNSNGYQGNRPAGDRPAYQGNGYQGNRPTGDRPAGDSRPPYNSNGYQGNRPAGDRPAYQGNGYQGNRPAGDRPAYQGNGYQGNGYQGNKPAGDRPTGDRPAYQGNGYQGNRPAGGPARPQSTTGGQPNRGGYGTQGGYNRPNTAQRPSGGGGYAPRGFESSNKDDDDKQSFNRAPGKKGPSRPGGERKNFDQTILDQKVAAKTDNSNKRNRDRLNKEKNYKEKNLIDRNQDGHDIKTKLVPRKGQFIQPKPVHVIEEVIKVIAIPEILTIKELADKMKRPSAALIKKLFLAGKIVTLNQEITYEEAEEIAIEYEIITEKEVLVNQVEELLKEEEEDLTTMVKRPPVVCVMGHVDHGKTSLLDAIRETNVISREAGGITQHIGAYVVEVNGEKITFLDTPGHEAFTSMRKRGAKSTDIAILVIAADDGVMPQTIEAINHAKAAGVQIIVAINKIDKPSANIERVKQELTEYELVAEDWGGDTIFVPVSAHTKEGIDHLLEMILLTAEIMELKANSDRNARGIVIEAELDKGRGPVATILVQKGTLRVGDNVAVGACFGKVRALIDDKGRRVKEATPSTPVEILGLNEVPDAGETFLATTNEKEARTIAEAYLTQSKEKLIADTKAKLSLDGLFSQIKAGNIKDLNLIIKADVQGSVEAMKQSLLKLNNEEVAIRVIHSGVGAINESDVILASTSNAIIIGFNVRPENAAKDTADRENVEVKLYRVIYDAINDIEAAMKGMLDPIFEEKIIGHAEIRMTFKASGIGTIAGSYVLDGKIIRGSKVRVYRDNSLIYDGILSSLKRFQDDVKEVATGYECGLVFDKFNEVKEGDKVELYVMAEVPR
jgi:translation initiation factor IF-2